MVINVIDVKCDEIIQSVGMIRKYFKTQVDKIVEKQKENVDVQQQNKINPISMLNKTNDEIMMIGIQLGATTMSNDETKDTEMSGDEDELNAKQIMQKEQTERKQKDVTADVLVLMPSQMDQEIC